MSEDLIDRARAMAERYEGDSDARLFTALADRIAVLEAGLRTIAQVPELDHWAGVIARDLLKPR